MEPRLTRKMARATLAPPNGKKQRVSDDTASQLSVTNSITNRGSSRATIKTRQSLDRRASIAPSEALTNKSRPSEPVTEVVHFVYSEAVEKAIRRGYKTSAFPPLSGPRLRRDNTFMVHSLPNIYSDLVTVRHMRKRNVQREQEFRNSMPDLYAEMTDDLPLKESQSRVPRLRLKMAAAGAMNDLRRQRAGFGPGLLSPKLPSLLLNRARHLQTDKDQ